MSHDRTFVNNVITDVIHFENKALTYYKGDYDTFEKTRIEKVIDCLFPFGMSIG